MGHGVVFFRGRIDKLKATSYFGLPETQGVKVEERVVDSASTSMTGRNRCKRNTANGGKLKE
jgi:hypothetical protein